MKRRSLFFCLAVLLLMQISQGSDLYFNLSFSPLSNSPPAPDSLAGYANYFNHRDWISRPPTTNDAVVVYVQLPAWAQGWIMTLQDDASLTPVVELTNEFQDAFTNIWFNQAIPLTTNQIQDLISGRWYIEVDFGDSNYISNLTPDFSTAGGPRLAVGFFPQYNFFRFFWGAIATNNHAATIVFNGSLSTDPFYIPLQFLWGRSDDNSNYVAFAATPMATNSFPLGLHYVSVQATDGITTNGINGIAFEVITPADAVVALRSAVLQSNLRLFQRNYLSDTLSAAASAFDRGNMALGVKYLQSFQNQIRLFRIPTTTSTSFLRASQTIIDLMTGKATSGGGGAWPGPGRGGTEEPPLPL